MALFITFEGGEGSGKSTQAARLRARLEAQGLQVVSVREPGGTTLGENLRRWVKGVDLSPGAELFLFAAARAQLVAEVIRPSLALDRTVLADRFADSTIAYQGYGRGLALDLVHTVNLAATQGITPDLSVLLDLPVEEAMQRLVSPQLNLSLGGERQDEAGRAEEIGQSRFERESLAFHRRVRSGFLKLARQEPHRVLVVDASPSAEDIAAAIWRRVQPLVA